MKCVINYNETQYCMAGKFGGELNLVVWQPAFATAKLKSTKISYLHIIYMYGDPVSNHQIKEMIIWDPTAKFNSCQYFWLYGNTNTL